MVGYWMPFLPPGDPLRGHPDSINDRYLKESPPGYDVRKREKEGQPANGVPRTEIGPTNVRPHQPLRFPTGKEGSVIRPILSIDSIV